MLQKRIICCHSEDTPKERDSVSHSKVPRFPRLMKDGSISIFVAVYVENPIILSVRILLYKNQFWALTSPDDRGSATN